MSRSYSKSTNSNVKYSSSGSYQQVLALKNVVLNVFGAGNFVRKGNNLLVFCVCMSFFFLIASFSFNFFFGFQLFDVSDFDDDDGENCFGNSTSYRRNWFYRRQRFVERLSGQRSKHRLLETILTSKNFILNYYCYYF